jgi:small conductance mechanosensitive channel
MNLLTALFLPLLAAADEAAPLIVPDSVQKANFAEAVRRLANLDIDSLLRSLLSESIWIVVKILIALAIYFIGRWIVRRLIRFLDAICERRQVDISLRSFLRNTVRVVFMLLLVLIVVSTLGVNVTSLIAVFSAATLAIGMALSGTAQNFAGGVMILLMKPYRVGDYISAQGQSGTVREIKLFSTVITTVDNQTIYIPNNSIATAIIDNYSTADLRRVDWTVGISYGDDVDAARQAILAMFSADARILREPEAPASAVVWVGALADSSVNLTVRAWTRNADYWNVYFEYNERFYKELPAAGINFPFPQMDVHLKKE